MNFLAFWLKRPSHLMIFDASCPELANLVLMIKIFGDKALAKYWFNVFAWYALVEAFIQLLFFIVLNNFGTGPISLIEIHFLMWGFQCLLILPIWWVAWWVRNTSLALQVIVNLVFYLVYSHFWFGPVQDVIGYLYYHFIETTRNPSNRIEAILDSGDQYSYINYQLLKHSFRLAWFYIALYFCNYQLEEEKKIQLAITNRNLQLKMLEWHLNPAFYFKTIHHLKQMAKVKPLSATRPILQLAKVMEYVIYEAKEKLIAVKKELQFLENYKALVNQQQQHHSLEINITGEYERLKIAPLLLVAFVENIIKIPAEKNRTCLMRICFSRNEMLATFSINAPFNLEETEALRRLEELYSGHYFIHQSLTELKLTLILNEG